MELSLALTALLMGITGGPHCIAMCGGVCAGLNQQSGSRTLLNFQVGRILGYATLGGLAAFSVQGIAWLSSHSAALRPLWVFFHVLILAWGVVLVMQARQPLWAERLGKQIWAYIRRASQHRGGIFATGMLWALMPCGLLYSALLIAALNNSAAGGALSMGLFALGTTISLQAGPWLWQRLRNKNEKSGMRLAGLLLIFAAGWALWMDMAHQIALWCAR
ncbi:MAG TPA: sulfite exporter TauE/SafE family protein [Methylophilaceae bacterium]|nr:sulfite exporter TauE/SafE family protein [Methylophilaceae bacterium]